MTPKVKAEQILERYYLIISDGDKESCDRAKEVALMVVDDIISAEPSCYSAWERNSNEHFWINVKLELQRLNP